VFCPVCKAEYREGFTRCTGCNVPLVATLPADQSEADASDLAVAWRGTDPSAFSAALAALQEAGIPSYQVSDHDQLVFELAIPRPQYRIMVRKTGLAAAQELVAPFGERAGLAHARDIWKGRSEFPPAGEESPQDELAESPSPDEHSPDDISAERRPQEATREVWSGDDPDVAENLRVCLREVGIGCEVKEGNGKSRILVSPQTETRAREIVREVIEGTPPG
jgi:hypothetical protein